VSNLPTKVPSILPVPVFWLVLQPNYKIFKCPPETHPQQQVFLKKKLAEGTLRPKITLGTKILSPVFFVHLHEEFSEAHTPPIPCGTPKKFLLALLRDYSIINHR